MFNIKIIFLGHSNNYGNDMADELAKAAIEKKNKTINSLIFIEKLVFKSINE